MQKPQIKTLRDKVRSMIVDRRSTDASNAAASGISEEVGPVDQLLEDIILEKDTFEEGKKQEKDDLDAREEALVSTGETIQRNAVSRRLSVGDDGTGSSRSTPRKRRNTEDLEEWNALLCKELEDRREARKREFELRQIEVSFTRDRWEE